MRGDRDQPVWLVMERRCSNWLPTSSATECTPHRPGPRFRCMWLRIRSRPPASIPRYSRPCIGTACIGCASWSAIPPPTGVSSIDGSRANSSQLALILSLSPPCYATAAPAFRGVMPIPRITCAERSAAPLCFPARPTAVYPTDPRPCAPVCCYSPTPRLGYPVLPTHASILSQPRESPPHAFSIQEANLRKRTGINVSKSWEKIVTHYIIWLCSPSNQYAVT